MAKDHGRLLAIVAGVVAALALGVSACSNNSTAPATPSLSQVQADRVGEVVASDADGEIEGATSTGSGPGYLTERQPILSALVAAASSYQCTTTRSPAAPRDQDKDGVPDSVRLTFTGCVLSLPLETDSVSGIVDIIDPTPTVADHSIKSVFTNLRYARLITASGKHTAKTVNGVRTSSRDTTTLMLTSTNLQTQYLFADGSTATHVRSWSATFTADVAGSIKPDVTLPSGTWSITGTSSWTRGSTTWSLTVQTNPALHYNATCTLAPRFDSGTLTAVVTQGSKSSTVTIKFTACGQYTVTRS